MTFEWKCSFCNKVLIEDYYKKQDSLYFCNQECSEKYRELIDKKDKLSIKIKELLDNDCIILYIDTDSIMYIDAKLNLIEEDLDKL